MTLYDIVKSFQSIFSNTNVNDTLDSKSNKQFVFYLYSHHKIRQENIFLIYLMKVSAFLNMFEKFFLVSWINSAYFATNIFHT